jgi:hypothetical protein
MNRTATLITTAAVLATAALPAAATAQTTTARQYEGTVVSVDRGSKTFRLRDTERGTIRIRVTGRTRFERIAGFRGLRRGMTNVEAVVRRVNGRWVASSVEISGGGGRHGGDD